MSALLIEPDTRVADLLKAHPDAEKLLIDMAPQFKALKNPVLRRTVAKVASLEQAAKVAGIPVRDLVVGLRRELGIEGGGEVAGGAEDEVVEAPEWVDLDAEPAIDGGALLDAGETPIARASLALGEMESGEVLVVSAPFRPEPLIDTLRGKGHGVFSRADMNDSWRVWIRRA